MLLGSLMLWLIVLSYVFLCFVWCFVFVLGCLDGLGLCCLWF